MLIVLMGYLIILIDNSLVFTCSSQIGASFRMSTVATTWISNGYALTFGSLLLLGGRLGDVWSRQKIFILGLVIFGTSSLLVGIAPNSICLILARLFQGSGAAIIAPATLAIIMDNFEGKEQARAIIMYGAMSGIGISLGLIIGAGITTISSWRYGFLVNVPIAALLVVLTERFIPENIHSQSNIDYGGALLSFLGITFVINGINGVGPKLISLLFGLVLLITFVDREKQVKDPLLPFSIFPSGRRVGAYLIRFVYSGAITSFWFFTPRMLHSFYHFNPLMIGLSFLPMTIVNYLAAQLVNRLILRFKNEQIMASGIIIASLGFAMLITLHHDSSFWLRVVPATLLVGFGQGLILSPVTTIALEGLPANLGGIASGVINVMLQTGGIFALAILAIISANHPILIAYRIQITGCTVLSLASLVLALVFYYVRPFLFKSMIESAKHYW